MSESKLGVPSDLFMSWVEEPESVCKDEFQQIIRISLQKVADISERAIRYGAEVEFERIREWLKDNDEPALASRLPYNNGHEPPSLKNRALNALDSPSWGPEQSQIVRKALLTIPD